MPGTCGKIKVEEKTITQKIAPEQTKVLAFIVTLGKACEWAEVEVTDRAMKRVSEDLT